MAFKFVALAALLAASAGGAFVSSGPHHTYTSYTPTAHHVVAHHAPETHHVVAHHAPAAVYHEAAPQYTYHHAPAVAVAHAHPVVKTVAYAAPAVAYAAPAVAYAAHVEQPAAPKVHNIYTQSGRTHLRLEEYQTGPQVIRVHEDSAAAPEVVRVQAPADQQALVRVINKPAGQATAERIVHRNNEPTVHTLNRPGAPGVRIVQAIKGAAPAPRIEFHSEGGDEGSVHHFTDDNSRIVEGPSVGSAPAFQAAPISVRSYSAAPAFHAAPVTVRAYSAGPATTYGTAPVSLKTIHI